MNPAFGLDADDEEVQQAQPMSKHAIATRIEELITTAGFHSREPTKEVCLHGPQIL